MMENNEYDYIEENRDAILELYENLGVNVVPIPKGRGKKLGVGWDKYAIEKCNDLITKDLDLFHLLFLPFFCCTYRSFSSLSFLNSPSCLSISAILL